MGTQEISPELVERMVALVRALARHDGPTIDIVEARAIVTLLPEPVDPDLVEAREMVALGHDVHAIESLWHEAEAVKCRSGDNDRAYRIIDTLAGIKRGRELAVKS